MAGGALPGFWREGKKNSSEDREKGYLPCHLQKRESRGKCAEEAETVQKKRGKKMGWRMHLFS